MSFATTLYDPVFAGERVPIYVLNATLRTPSTQPSVSLVSLDEHGTTSTNVSALIDQIKADVDLTSYRLIADSYSRTETDSTFRKKIDMVPYNEISHGTLNETTRYGTGAGVALSTAVGGNAGIQNTAIGRSALGQASGNCYSNVAIGFRAGYGILTGDAFQNVFIGRNAGNNGEPGSYNICIGSSANAQTFSSCISMGYNTTATADGQIKLTTSSPSGGTYISGIRQYNTPSEDIVATIGSDNRLGGRSLTTAVTALAYTKAEIGDLFYTKMTTDSLLLLKADKATTYTITESDGKFRLIADSYTKADTDGLLLLKANQATTYTKIEADGKYRLIADSYTKTATDTLLATKFDATNLHGYLTGRPALSPVVSPFGFVTHTSTGISQLSFASLVSALSTELNDPPILTNATSIYNKKHSSVPTLVNSAIYSTLGLGLTPSVTNSVVAAGGSQPVASALFNTTIVNPRVSSNWNGIDSFTNCCYINGAPKPGSGARSGEIVINSTKGNGEKSLTINDEAFGTLKVFIPGLESA